MAERKIRFTIKKPTHKGRSSFSIVKDELYPSGKRTQVRVKDPRLDVINHSYKTGEKAFPFALKEVEEIVRDLKEKTLPKDLFLYHKENEKLIEAYWKKVLSRKRLKSPESARNRLKRAIRPLGNHSLFSISEDKLYKCLEQYSGNRQRSRVTALNSLLKFIGRDIKIMPDLPEYPEVEYVTETELQKLLAKIEDPYTKALTGLCFYSGLRVGEAFGLRPQSLRKDIIYVDSQISRKGKRVPPKSRKPRHAFLLSAGVPYFWTWLELKDKAPSRWSIGRELSKASEEALGRKISIHDMRHSYAIHMLSLGVSLSLVAQSLGNSVTVCERYYTGFVLSVDSIEAIRGIVNQK